MFVLSWMVLSVYTQTEIHICVNINARMNRLLYLQEKYVDCTDVQYSESEEDGGGMRRVLNPNQLVLHSAYHNESGRRQGIGSGGFCEV